MSTYFAQYSIHKWESCCKPGMWLANLSSALGETGAWHVHADCVVDDFGNLVPVAFSGLTANEKLFRIAS
jgi:hypothetical protein